MNYFEKWGCLTGLQLVREKLIKNYENTCKSLIAT